jgi:serine/threonine-protein kinase RsbT
VAIGSEADVVTVCQEARRLAAGLGFAGAELAHVVTAVSEVAGNVRLYAGRGEVVLAAAEESDRVGIAVVARDAGPGIPDIGLAMQDGWSTAGSMGLGLPGARRLMDEFEITSEVGRGTTVAMRRWRAKPGMPAAPPEPLVEWEATGSGAGRREVVAEYRNGVLLAAVAGAGGADRAAQAALAAAEVLGAEPHGSAIELVERCHESLDGTTGAALAVASFSALDATLTWLAVGSAEGTLSRTAPGRGPTKESAPAHAGLVGRRLPALRASTATVVRGDTLVLGCGGLVLSARFLRGSRERRPSVF